MEITFSFRVTKEASWLLGEKRAALANIALSDINIRTFIDVIDESEEGRVNAVGTLEEVLGYEGNEFGDDIIAEVDGSYDGVKIEILLKKEHRRKEEQKQRNIVRK